jgi:hypothetical protein
MACFLHAFFYGCIDYVRLEEKAMIEENYHFPPIIDAKVLYPQPSALLKSISVGKNCNGQVFKVPPIYDRNSQDRLHYLWFFDNELAVPIAAIEPEYRSNSVITLTINEQFLLSHFQTNLPKDFFNRPHVIEFFVSDRQYSIPESRLIEGNGSDNDRKEHEAYVYWIAMFSNDSC